MKEKKRILAIDYGRRRIGLALSDAFHWTARPLKTIDQKKSSNIHQQIKVIIEEHDVGEIVVGMPYNMDGSKGFASEGVENFVRRLKEVVSCPIAYEDERLTTTMAHDVIQEMGHSRKIRKQKGKVDQMAAAMILQSYLSRKKISQ